MAVLPSGGVDESGGRAWLTERAALSATGRSQRLPLTQFSDNTRGRQLAEVVPLAALADGNGHGDAHAKPAGYEGGHGGEGDHGEHGSGEGHGDGGHHEILLPFDAALDAAPDSPYRWGMTVDTDRCTGCSACVTACYVENNIPVVGEEETLRVRQMAWLRIERFDPSVKFRRVLSG